MDYMQDYSYNVSLGETLKVVRNRRQGGRNVWRAWLARWEKDVLGLVGKPDGKKSLGRHGCKWDSNIKINLNEISYRGGWVHLAQTRDRNHGYKYLPAAQNAGNLLTRWRSIGLTSGTAQSSQATEGQDSTARPLET